MLAYEYTGIILILADSTSRLNSILNIQQLTITYVPQNAILHNGKPHKWINEWKEQRCQETVLYPLDGRCQGNALTALLHFKARGYKVIFFLFGHPGTRKSIPIFREMPDLIIESKVSSIFVFFSAFLYKKHTEVHKTQKCSTSRRAVHKNM